VKKLLVFALVIVLMSIMAHADEKAKPCSEACKAKCGLEKAAVKTTAAEAKDAHSGCEAKAAEAVKTEAVAPAAATEQALTDAKAPKIAETCPDVDGNKALENFHNAMSPMHMALEDNKYAEVRGGYAELLKASEGVKTYSCPMGDKCPPECKKSFDEKKSTLLKDVEELGAACKGTDDKQVDAAFMAMHEAYVSFASMCKHDKPSEDKK
jgi:hypothetical protein